MDTVLNMVKNMKRLSGILLHPTSLPGEYGIGDLGPEAYAFVDFLEESGQHIWQTLPLGATGYYNSPYQCFSSFAGQPLLISPDFLRQDGLLTDEDFWNKPYFDENRVQFTDVKVYKEGLYQKAFARFKNVLASVSDEELSAYLAKKAEDEKAAKAKKEAEEKAAKADKADKETAPKSEPKKAAPFHRDAMTPVEIRASFEAFQKENDWLSNYSMFMAIRKAQGETYWLDWEKKYRQPTEKQKKEIAVELADGILYQDFLQWAFYTQWADLKAYANAHGILLFGDIPIFVSADSADVWTEPDLFLLEDDGHPSVVAGVPPDYFSATGQLWGNPLYDWKQHKKTNFKWWLSRISAQLKLSDIIRIDHFRGLESYWEIPADAETAMEGQWKPGPGNAFFDAMIKEFGKDIPIIAEDLGIITDEVRALRDRYNLPGMKILQFAFDGDDSDYLPYNHIYNCVCYTGTHDNDTSKGWYDHAPEKSRDIVRRYMNTDASQVSWDFIRTCFGSTAKYAIVPVQDLLCQGSEHRMNIPGSADGNWSYRFRKGALNSGLADYLRQTTKLFGRC